MKKKINELPFINNPKILSAELRRLYSLRMDLKKTTEKNKRQVLSKEEKIELLNKTGNRCHICGELISGSDFQIDHIAPRSIGGKDCIENYLVSCKQCNNYRWNYLPEEIRWLMKIGIWAKTQIEFETSIGKSIAKEFTEYEIARENRRKKVRDPLSLDIEKHPVREQKCFLKFK